MRLIIKNGSIKSNMEEGKPRFLIKKIDKNVMYMYFIV